MNIGKTVFSQVIDFLPMHEFRKCVQRYEGNHKVKSFSCFNHSRYVLSWRISNAMDVSFCREALEEALGKGRPEIFDSDQGSQFTSNDFTGILLDKEIAISMDGRGRAFDNIFMERLWRSVKYEEVYIKDYEVCRDAREGLEKYFSFYNNRRYHQSLEYKTPYEVHFGVPYGTE
ncbi:integrase [Candidatus Brocadia pituitae]|nr:integrase [Candidatus Brocadia pituitae]